MFKNLCVYVHSSMMPSQKAQTTQMSISFSSKEDRGTDTCHDMDEP